MNLVEWLTSLKDMKEVIAGKFVFDGVAYEAAKYKQGLTPPDGAKNHASYISEMIYILGNKKASLTDVLPEKILAGKVALTMAGDFREWFVATYMKDWEIKPEFAHAHPFGSTLQVCPWTSEDQKIDKFEIRPYKRFPCEFIPNT